MSGAGGGLKLVLLVEVAGKSKGIRLMSTQPEKASFVMSLTYLSFSQHF